MSQLATDLPALDQPYLDGLGAGSLMFQQCRNCKNAWMPARSECPRCLESNYLWVASNGKAKLISWVVYHRAFSEALKERVPYIVAIIELAEGPRMISNVGYEDLPLMATDRSILLRIDCENGRFVPRFRVTTNA